MRTTPSIHALLLAFALVTAPAHAQTCRPLPDSMRAARIHAPGGPEALVLETVPLPAPGPGQVLVRVAHASVNPVDWKLQLAGRLPYPAIPGGDFSGEIVALGPGVEAAWRCGHLVAGIADPQSGSGSYAEYVAVPVDAIVPQPPRYSSTEAAAYPTVAVAAWRFLVATGAVQRGERVLVHGGAGGVGSMLVQIAKSRGAHVIATASARNHDYLRGLGADEVVDYRSQRFEDAVAPVDLVVDTVGGDTLMRSPAVLRDGGRLVTLVGRLPEALCADGRISCPTVAPWDVQAGLGFVAPLIAAGELRIHIERVHPLDEVRLAQETSRAGHVRGKIVLDLGPDAAPPADPATR